MKTKYVSKIKMYPDSSALLLQFVEKCQCSDRCTVVSISIATEKAAPSPLLFFLGTEQFAQAVIASQLVFPVVIDVCMHCISLYADDILFYLTKVGVK